MIDLLKAPSMSLPGVDGAGLVSGSRATRPQGTANVAGSEFSTLIGEALVGVSDRLRKAEATSITGIRGNASTQAVVEEVMAAEQSLQAAIAVRDKIVSAYLEISRMAI